jgi:ketosteroid isomerase-like protein
MRLTIVLPLVAALFPTAFQGETGGVSPALESLVEAERAFARAAVQKGIRDSFLEYFADDALALTPEAQSAKERLRTRPARPFSELELIWEPRTGDVAVSGDLGWLTGPSTFIDHTASPPRVQHGNYLSIWRRQADGQWRVFIDIGCQVPQPPDFAPGFTPLALPDRWGQGDGGAARERLTTNDRELNRALARDGAPRAYGAVLADGARLHRQGKPPLVGRGPIVAWLERQDVPVAGASAESTAAAAAASGDLGYSYGLYELRTTPIERGAYVRVWARDAAGRWWLVAEVTEPAS